MKMEITYKTESKILDNRLTLLQFYIQSNMYFFLIFTLLIPSVLPLDRVIDNIVYCVENSEILFFCLTFFTG